MRKLFTWTLPQTTLNLGQRTLVMGVLNVTPDSFSEGGKHLDPKVAANRAREMQDQGADVIDIGGESSRPGSIAVSEEEELRRVLPVVKALAGTLSIPVSVDTYRAEVAEKALGEGAQIINDISAFRFDSEMPRTVSRYGAGVVLMHSRGERETLHLQLPMADPVQTVRCELTKAIRNAEEAGISKSAIVIDPGIGFGKSAEESKTVLRNLEAVSQLEYPLLVGTSRKSFLRRIESKGFRDETVDRLWGTAASVASAVFHGAHIVRVHDVAEIRRLVDVLDAL